MSLCDKTAGEHQILTLGTEKLSWRMIECSLHHYPHCGGICINGVLYYPAYQGNGFAKSFMVVCFDVRSEELKFIHKYCGTKCCNVAVNSDKLQG